MQYLLGIDLGTSGLKAAVFDRGGRILGIGYSANQYLQSIAGCAEQDPRMWWEGACRAVRAALVQSQVDASKVVGIGVCGFHHCPVFLDADGEPTRPTIVTHDVRLGESLEDLRRSGVLSQVIRGSGSLVLMGHFPPIYHWVRDHDRQALDRTRWILLAKDYIRYRLTGGVGTEICDATGTNLVAMPEDDWSSEICGLLGVPMEKLPKIGSPSEVFGTVTTEAQKETGLAAGTPVVYGGGDSHCALVGLGIIGSGEVGLLLGTNSTLRASFEGFVKDTEPKVWAQRHVVPGRYTVSASSMAGSSILAWFGDMFCGEHADGDDSDVYRELELLAADAPPGCDGLMFHPYLRGERSPFDNPNARGSFIGITHWHGKGHFVRSVTEGIAFCIANCLDLIKEIAAARSEKVSPIRMGQGGGGRLKLWRQVIADALDFPLEVVAAEEPGCLGTAILAGVGVGMYKDIESAVRDVVCVKAEIMPNPQNSIVYKEAREKFNSTYRAIEPLLYR